METWHSLVIAPIIVEWMREVCGNQPEADWELERVMSRLNVHVQLMEGAAADAGPHARADVIYVPGDKGSMIRTWLLHELAELATRYDGIPPVIVPSSGAWDRHLVACAVEKRLR